jgi:ubiquinone/menaquinone biosynthesis methyltransferase
MIRVLSSRVLSKAANKRAFIIRARKFSASSTEARHDPYLKGDDTHFGFETVAVNEKEGKVREVFESVADSYDIMNDLMSGGLHRYWKDHLLDISAVASMSNAVRQHSGSELRIIDVAGGTGDVAFRFINAAGCAERSMSSGEDPISVTVCDINPEMLRVGEARARERYGSSLIDETKALSFVEGNAQSLDFPDNSFDLYTIAFGLRNVTDVDKALCEARRVLKPGGRFMCLEFSQVPDPILRQMYDAFSFNVIPEIGQIVANDRHSYQYLVESIRKFSNQEELISRMSNAGFELTKYSNLTGGIVAIHEGWKPLSS